MKKVIFAFCFAAISFTSLFSQPLFTDNFNYPVRDTLKNVNGWYSSHISPPAFVKIVSPGLTYSGYLGSGSGNCAYLTNESNTNASTNHWGFEANGTIYLSFLIKVDNFTAGATEGYNICLDQSGGSTNLNTKFYIKKISTTTYNIGIKKFTGSPVYSSNVYNTGSTYLAVISYTFKPGSTSNDVTKAFFFNSGVPASEPVSPLALDSAGTDLPDIGDLVISNSFIQTGLQETKVRIDGIRIGKSWAGTLLQNKNIKLNMTALIQGFYNDITNKMVSDTVSVSLRYDRPPYSIAETVKSVLDSNGTGDFIFTKIGNQTNYYIAVNNRNMLESWSNIPKEFYLDSLYNNFTFGASSTYGNNAVQKGFRYCFYNGEIIHDGIIDVTDYQYVDNNSFNFVSGYKTTDLNGDDFTDISDMSIVELNTFNFVQAIKP